MERVLEPRPPSFQTPRSFSELLFKCPGLPAPGGCRGRGAHQAKQRLRGRPGIRRGLRGKGKQLCLGAGGGARMEEDGGNLPS